MVSTPFSFSGLSIYSPICFAIPSSLQAAAPVLNGCISTSLKGMLTDSPRSDGKRLLVFITVDAGGARKTIWSLKKGSPSFKGLSELCTPHFGLWWTRTTGLGKHKQNFWLSSLERMHVRHKVIYSHCCHQTFSDQLGVPLSFESTTGLDLCRAL